MEVSDSNPGKVRLLLMFPVDYLIMSRGWEGMSEVGENPMKRCGGSVVVSAYILLFVAVPF